MKYLAIALIALLIFASTASAHPTCQLHRNRNGQSVTVVRGPCYRHDFPANCRVPAVIEQGQTVYCPK